MTEKSKTPYLDREKEESLKKREELSTHLDREKEESLKKRQELDGYVARREEEEAKNRYIWTHPQSDEAKRHRGELVDTVDPPALGEAAAGMGAAALAQKRYEQEAQTTTQLPGAADPFFRSKEENDKAFAEESWEKRGAPFRDAVTQLRQRQEAARKRFKATRGRGMPSAGSFKYLSAHLRPLAGGKYFPRNWEAKMDAALKGGEITKEQHTKAVKQYTAWLNSGIGAQVTAGRAHVDAEQERNLGMNAADQELAAANMKAEQARMEGIEKVMHSEEEYMQFERDARAKVEGSLAKFEDAREQMAKRKTSILGGMETRVMGAIASALGGLGAILTGGENVAMKIVQQGIQARAKEAELQFKRDSSNVRAAGNAFAMAMNAVGDERAARQATMNMLYRNTQQHVEGLMRIASNKATKQKLEELHGFLGKQADLSEADLRAQILSMAEKQKVMAMRARGRALKNARTRSALGARGAVTMDKPPAGKELIRVARPNGQYQSVWVENEAAKRHNVTMAATRRAQEALKRMRGIVVSEGGDTRGSISYNIQDTDNEIMFRDAASTFVAATKEAANTGAALTQVEVDTLLPLAMSLSEAVDADTHYLEKGNTLSRVDTALAGLERAREAEINSMLGTGIPGGITYEDRDDGTKAPVYFMNPMDPETALQHAENARPVAETAANPYLTQTRE